MPLPREEADTQRAWVRRWGPVVIYVALVFAVSSVPRLRPPSSWPSADKAAHVVEYGVLGFLMRRSLAGRKGAGVVSVLTAAAVGALDELYQSAVPGRFPSPLDWGADLAGSLIGSIAQPYLVAGARRMTNAGSRKADASGEAGKGSGAQG